MNGCKSLDPACRCCKNKCSPSPYCENVGDYCSTKNCPPGYLKDADACTYGCHHCKKWPTPGYYSYGRASDEESVGEEENEVLSESSIYVKEDYVNLEESENFEEPVDKKGVG